MLQRWLDETRVVRFCPELARDTARAGGRLLSGDTGGIVTGLICTPFSATDARQRGASAP